MSYLLICKQYLSVLNVAFTVVVVFRIKNAVDDSISVVKQSFDNEVTPYFALVICLWGKGRPFRYFNWHLVALIKIFN